MEGLGERALGREGSSDRIMGPRSAGALTSGLSADAHPARSVKQLSLGDLGNRRGANASDLREAHGPAWGCSAASRLGSVGARIDPERTWGGLQVGGDTGVATFLRHSLSFTPLFPANTENAGATPPSSIYWRISGGIVEEGSGAGKGPQPPSSGGCAQRYFSVRTEDTMDRNLSQAVWASAVKSAGKCEATVTSRQWDRS